MPQYIAAIDQGTTSTRTMLFDRSGPVAMAQREHAQHFPHAGWVEHDPLEIWRRTCETITDVLDRSHISGQSIAALGITNQRETTVVWDPITGQPYCNAIVWQDTRTKEICDALSTQDPRGIDRFRDLTGLPLATYFSGPKLRWILDNIPGVREAVRGGRAIFGTIDTYLIWNLTGGPKGGAHVTDVTNASRTMLMNLRTLDWDESMLRVLDIPPTILPRIGPSSDPRSWGMTFKDGPWRAEIPVCGDLGDQQAALVGQTCFEPGESKNTYGTGCFMLLNTGPKIVHSTSGLLTTLAYQFANQPACYALEGSIAIAGALVHWLRDNLGLIKNSSEIESLASAVNDNGGVYIVPAFSGLFAPWWRSDARGLIIGLSRHSSKSHIARAALEATAFQTRDVLDAMNKDSPSPLLRLKVDGGMAVNELLMQFQADILGVPVVRPRVTETTALGAAYAAGLAVGFWRDLNDLKAQWKEDCVFTPKLAAAERQRLHQEWLKAVAHSFDWLK